MKYFEISVLLIYVIWLLCAILVALSGSSRLLRFRNFLWFNGWFNQWTMFVPAKNEKKERFTITYRDKFDSGKIGPWQLIELEKAWDPPSFLINPNIRFYGFMIQAVRSFGQLHNEGKQPKDSKLFNFFNNLIISYDRNEKFSCRQIKVERSIGNKDPQVLLESDFLNQT